jgi:hypothetical protein
MVAMFKILGDSELESVISNPDCVEDLLFPEDVDDPFEGQYDIDKSWHAIHYLITGSTEPDGTPVGDAILGGRPVGTDLGYGPARLIEPKHVKRIAGALQGIDLEAAYDSLDRSSANDADVYLGFDFSGDEKEHLRRFFDVVSNAYSNAASSDRAVLLYLT